MKTRWRALLVDDERLARAELRSLLAPHEQVDIVGEADSLEAAVECIERLHPDLVFLDIQMPGGSGFDLLDRVRLDARIIFVTAFDAHALRAFEVNALDYLLKPVSPDRLAQALERLAVEDLTPEPPVRRLQAGDRLFIQVDGQMRFIALDQIKVIAALGDYSEIWTVDGRKGLAQKPLKSWEQRLPEQDFVRIHRSTIVHMGHVERVEDWFHAAYRVYVRGIAEPFVMSRRYASRIKQRLG